MLQPEILSRGSFAHELGRLVRGLSDMDTQGRWQTVHLENGGGQDREAGKKWKGSSSWFSKPSLIISGKSKGIWFFHI